MKLEEEPVGTELTTFTGLGYGTPGEILARLPADTRTVIRDDAAATAGQTDVWFASEAAWQDAQAAYCDDRFEGAVYTVADLTDAATADLLPAPNAGVSRGGSR